MRIPIFLLNFLTANSKNGRSTKNDKTIRVFVREIVNFFLSTISLPCLAIHDTFEIDLKLHVTEHKEVFWHLDKLT